MPHQLSVTKKNIVTKPSLVNKKSHVKSFESIEKEDARFQMISEAAYYRAMGRGFDGGDPLQDWLISEVKIDGKLLEHS